MKHSVSQILCKELFGLDVDLSFKVNEPPYKRCGATPHFPKTKKKTAENFVEAGSAITIDNNSSN